MSFDIRVNDNLSLVLRDETQAEEVFALVEKNREELRKWLPWVDETHSVEDSRKYIAECKKEFEEKKSADFAIVYDSKIIGSGGFHMIKLSHEWAEIGYWLDGDYVGKGIMTECVRAMMRYGFDELNLHRIQIKCDSLNVKSKAIPERLGFKLEGITREDHKRDGKFSDGLIYGLLRSEWIR